MMFNSCFKRVNIDKEDVELARGLMDGTLTSERAKELVNEKARKELRETWSPIVY